MNKLALIFSILFFSVVSNATSPKQYCKIQKDLKVVLLGMNSMTQFEAEVTYKFYVNMQGTSAEEVKSVSLDINNSAQNENVKVSTSTFKDSFGNSLYVKGLKSVTTKYYAVTPAQKVLLFEETESPLVYYQGQEVPMGPIVCFEYAN